MAQKMPIRIDKHEKAAGGAYDYVKTELVPQGEIWCLQNIAYENETGARGTFRRYVEGHGFNLYLWEVQGPGAAELISSSEELFLIPGERLVIRQETCTLNDILSLYAVGYKIHGSYLPDKE